MEAPGKLEEKRRVVSWDGLTKFWAEAPSERARGSNRGRRILKKETGRS